MAHECPECGQACYCDMDDTWMDIWATGERCYHKCAPDEEPCGGEWGGDESDEVKEGRTA